MTQQGRSYSVYNTLLRSMPQNKLPQTATRTAAPAPTEGAGIAAKAQPWQRKKADSRAGVAVHPRGNASNRRPKHHHQNRGRFMALWSSNPPARARTVQCTLSAQRIVHELARKARGSPQGGHQSWCERHCPRSLPPKMMSGPVMFPGRALILVNRLTTERTDV